MTQKAGQNRMKNRKILVTSALPYANGPIHIGHLVEYIQSLFLKTENYCSKLFSAIAENVL